jgi:hypothetical protein
MKLVAARRSAGAEVPQMTVSSDRIIRQYLEALKRHREETRGKPAKARAFLIKAGILSKDGKKLAKRYR